MIRWFIGYDPVESGAYFTLAHSLQRHSSMPISITPIDLRNLKGILTRERHPLQSNEFSFSRFLVPWMMGFEGWAIFSDCDMLCLDDPAKLWARRDDRYALMCVHHEHEPKEEVKYLGNVQTKYRRKNWSSVMLINCGHPDMKVLTPDYVNEADGLALHQFGFLENNSRIGYLPKEWNHLVGYDEPNHQAKLVHFTEGGPYFEQYRNCEFHQNWWSENFSMRYIKEK
jgi:lipopolysaccharide biosynthesis glycosyltransferase